MNRRGNLEMMTPIVVVVGIALAGIVVAYMNLLASPTAVFTTNTAANLGMMVNTISSMEGDVIAKYPHNVSKLTISLTPHIITVQQGQLAEVRTDVVLPVGYLASGEVRERDFVCLQKRGDRIRLMNCAQLQCEERWCE